jgi:hypothetical protein
MTANLSKLDVNPQMRHKMAQCEFMADFLHVLYYRPFYVICQYYRSILLDQVQGYLRLNEAN